MEYVLLDMRWNVTLREGKVYYDIKQLAAIHIDENMHTIDTFHFLDARDMRAAKRMVYMLESTEDVIIDIDIDIAWDKLRKWLPDNPALVVWNNDVAKVFNWYNDRIKSKKNRIAACFKYLQPLSDKMLPANLRANTLEGVMKSLELVCNTSYMVSSLYFTQVMLRLYRKLWKEGLKHFEAAEWKMILGGRYDLLRKKLFFEQFSKKHFVEKYRSEIEQFCEAEKYVLNITGTKVRIEGKQAVWRFDMVNKGADLTYVPKRYSQIPHVDVKVDESMGDMQKIPECVFEKISTTEKRLSYGVGSKYVEDIMQVHCEKYK